MSCPTLRQGRGRGGATAGPDGPSPGNVSAPSRGTTWASRMQARADSSGATSACSTGRRTTRTRPRSSSTCRVMSPTLAKASVACSNRGAAARVLGLGIARGGGHNPVWLSYPIPPPAGERKKAWKETLVHRIFCKDCCNLVRTADDLAARDCVPGYVVPTVRKMLQRIKARLEEKDVEEHIANEEAGVKRSCSKLGRRRPTQAVEQLREVAKEEAGLQPVPSWTSSASSTRRATRRRNSGTWREDWGGGKRSHEGFANPSDGNFECPDSPDLPKNLI